MTDYVTRQQRLSMFSDGLAISKWDKITLKFAKWSCIATALYICAQVVRVI